MTKKEFIEAASIVGKELAQDPENRVETFYTTKVGLNQSYKIFCQTIRQLLADGESVHLMGVGKLSGKVIPARERINPRTQEKIKVPERKTVKFKMSEEFRDTINED